MNSKIKKIAEQAGMFGACPPGMEKFAELIINATINECRQCWFDANNTVYDKDDKRAIGIRIGMKQGALTSIRAIKERFGVE